MKIFEFFQDEDGSLSMSRLIILFFTLTYCFLAYLRVNAGHEIPDFPYGLAGLVTFLYASNKAKPVLENIFGKPPVGKP